MHPRMRPLHPLRINCVVQTNVIEVNAIPKQSDTVTIPISELGMLGSTAASLLPSFRTVTQAASINTGSIIFSM